MPLYKRRCQECDHLEDDRFEQITAEMTIVCPTCNSVTFTKVFCVPKLEKDGMYSFFNALDINRQKAADGHGNQSLRL